MRICQIVNVGFEAGGAERSVRLLSEGLHARGHDVLVIATDHLLDGTQDVFADILVPAVRGGALKRLTGYFWHGPAYRLVRSAVREFRPDVVHLHTIGEFSPAVLAATRGPARVLTVHGPEDWTLRLLRWNLRSAATGAPRLSRGDTARLAYLRHLQRPAYLTGIRRLETLVTPSRFLAGQVLVDAGLVPVRVVPNGIRLPSSAPMPSRPEVLFVGRFQRVKGAHVLVRAFGRIAAHHPGARLTLVGDGPDRAELERLAADAPAGSIRFAGWLSGDALAQAYREAAVVAIPSIWPENFPTVALEALGTGRPVLASAVGGIPELVRSGHNGVLVPPGDEDALADALGDLLGDPARRAAMGEASAAAAPTYAAEAFVDRMENCYTETGERRARRRR